MIGQRLHNYKIEKLLEEGGMGTVYLGVHLHLGRKVAIKALNPSLLKNPEIKERFRTEATMLSKLNHPNIVALYDYIERPDGIFLVLEFAEGKTLDEYLNKVTGALPEQKAIRLFIKILDAVGYIHSKNIIHRDIKPSNIIITPDEDVKLLDFGIAKIFDTTNHSHTKTGSKVGTTLYMSPQQVKGQLIDRRTDIYSLGVTLFQMITGQYPYDENSTEYDIYSKIVNDPLPNTRQFTTNVNEKIQAIIVKATAKRPIDRYQSCDEFCSALLALQDKTEQPSLFFKSKLLEVKDFKKSQLLNRSFWRNLILLFLSFSFIGAIIIVLFNLQQNDIRHVISDKLQLSSTDSIISEKIETLNYGETVKVLKAKQQADKSGIYWLHVISLRGNVGYVPRNEVATPKIFDQINAVFADTYSQAQTPVSYKWALRKYYVDNLFLSKPKPDWKLFAEQKKDIGYNTIAEADYNDNGQPDYACVLKNSLNNKSRLLIIFDNKIEHIQIDFNGPIKIKPVKKGHDGGGWFLGNQTTRISSNGTKYTTNKYELLQTDGILLFKLDSQENRIYFFNKEENKINFFTQPK